MRRLATLMLAASVLILPACGKKTDETSRAAGITPTDALAILSLNLDPSIEQKRNLLSIARRFPDARDKVKGEFDDARDELIAEMLEDTGLAFDRDVKPWLGNEVAVAVLPPGDRGMPLIVGMVETDDGAAARRALDKAVEAGDFDGEYRVVKDFVVISDQENEGDDQRALDLVDAQAKKDDGGLAESKPFTEVVDQLAGDRLILGWVDVKDSLGFVEQLGSRLGGGELGGLGFVNRFGGEASTMALDLHAESDAVVFQGVAATSGGAKGSAAKLTRSLPQRTLAALTLFNVGEGVTSGLQAVTGADAGQFLAELESETGLDLEADILSWMQGELVLVAGDVPSGQPFPDFALVVKPSDRAKAEAGLEKIRQALARQGLSLEEREVAGAKAYVVPEPLTDGVQPAMALFADRFVLATRAEYLEELSKDHSPSLAETDAYQSVLGEKESDDTTMQFVALLDPIREAIENAERDDPDRAEYEGEVKPNLEPLSAFGIVARTTGGFARVEMKLTFD